MRYVLGSPEPTKKTGVSTKTGCRWVITTKGGSKRRNQNISKVAYMGADDFDIFSWIPWE